MKGKWRAYRHRPFERRIESDSTFYQSHNHENIRSRRRIVGLTTAACLAQIGHDVFCSESDLEKLATLQNGEMRIFEPHIENVIKATRNATGCVSDPQKTR